MDTTEPARSRSFDPGSVFSRREALGLGETTASLRSACRTGQVVRLRRGFYVSGRTWAESDDVARHLLRACAEARAQDGAVALCGASAAALRGLDLHDQDLSVVHLLRLDGGAALRGRTAHHHRVLDPGAVEVDVVAGVPCVSSAQAVWEVACRSSLEGGVVTADAALRASVLAAPSWAEIASRFDHVPGSRVARLALRLARPGSESVGESVTRVQCFRFGIPEPELQHEVRDEAGEVVARLDFWWEEFRHAGEFDGRVKYGRLRRSKESAEQAVFREKQREDFVRASERCGMTRFVWSGIMPDTARRTMSRLAQTMDDSRSLYVQVGWAPRVLA